MKPQLYIATNGLGVWYSEDLGENLIRMNSRMGMYSGNHIWAFANDPSDPDILLAGSSAIVPAVTNAISLRQPESACESCRSTPRH